MATGDEELSKIFKESCSVGSTAKQGAKTTMTTAVVTKWFKSAGLYGKFLTSNDTDIAFNKVKGDPKKKEITYPQFLKLLEEIAPKYMKQDKKCTTVEEAVAAMKEKLKCGIDSARGTTKTSKTGGVGRMTDTSQYTGSHKERFDESGKGKGKVGREDCADHSGYVGNYKGEGTYNEKH